MSIGSENHKDHHNTKTIINVWELGKPFLAAKCSRGEVISEVIKYHQERAKN